jgi:hypothetical protein
MHLIKASMLFMSASLMAVQGMRIGVKIDLDGLNPGLRATNKLKTAITQYPIHFADDHPSLDLVLESSRHVRRTLEELEEGVGNWRSVLDAMKEWSKNLHAVESDMGYHEALPCATFLEPLDLLSWEDEMSMETLAEMTCSAEKNAVREEIIRILVLMKADWGKWLGKFKSSCTDPDDKEAAAHYIELEETHLGRAIGLLNDTSACKKETNFESQQFQIPMEMK